MDKYSVFFSILFAFIFVSVVYADEKPVINEVVVKPSATKEWVEFYNPSRIDLSKYWIDDDTSFTEDNGASKKSLSGIANDTDYPLFETSSVFNNTGDHVVLFDPQGNIVDEFEYTQDPGEDISFGRSPNGTGEFNILTSLTKGTANSEIRPSPTSTPQPTPTPTKVPTPTKEPTPTKKPTGTKDAETITPSISAKITKAATQKNTLQKRASISGLPTAILRASDSSKSVGKPSKPRILIDSATKNNVVSGASIIGGAILFIACGILIFIKKRNELLQ